MPNVFTTTVTSSWDRTAYNRLLYFALRENNVSDALCDIKPTNQTTKGASVVFDFVADLAVASATLDESTDVDAVALSDSIVTVTLAEKGNAVIKTALLGLTSMVPVDPAIANVLGENAAKSMDALGFAELRAGSNVTYSPDAITGTRAADRAHTTANNKLSSTDFRYARNRLRRATVGKRNGAFTAVLHPDTLFDLRTETGGLGWMALHTYTETGVSMIYTDEIGMYEGFRTIESALAPVFADAGSSPTTTDVYGSLFLGAQALAKGYATSDGYGEQPITVKSPVVDKLERFQPWGWKHFVGYKRFREAAIYRIESGSSVGVNA